MPASRQAATFLLALLASAVCVLPSNTVEAELSKNNIKALVTEYANPKTEPVRRQVILAKLRAESRPVQALEAIKGCLKNDPERPYALELAAEFRVAGLFKQLKKEIDGADEGRIVIYCFATQDEGATTFLFDRWKEKPADKPSFTMVKEGFLKWYVDIETIGKFREYVKSKDAEPTKTDFARQILLAQMDLPLDSAAVIEDAWKAFYVDYKTNSVDFSFKGRDVLRMPGWDIHGKVRQFGQNYKLFKGGVMDLATIPEEWQKMSFSLKIGVRVTEGTGCLVGLVTDAGACAPIVEDDSWAVHIDGGGTYRDKDVVDYRRECTIRLDNRELLANGLIAGKLERIVIYANDKAELTVGGIDFAEKKK
jgi:hypothetical protein